MQAAPLNIIDITFLDKDNFRKTKMDVTLLGSITGVILLLIVVCTVFLGRRSATRKKQTNVPERAPQGRPVRRAAGQRNARRRMQTNVVSQVNDDEDASGNEGNDEADEKPDISDQKIGTKKRAKLAAKAERKEQREQAEREREERRKRDQLLQEQRDKESQKEHEEELRQEEAEKKAREEKEKRDYEEYLKMKEAFSIEDEGYDKEQQEDEENLLQGFVEYIKKNKVVILEDLAAIFNLKTASIIDRIQELQINGSLTGVIDDRGKFIYISQQELEDVAKFMKQRGRVSIVELAENSNRLINLNPESKSSIVEAR
ncbi:DDRGK domain-containing protein 1 [Hylaeus anthracinus]|uniref:DDRGK domain-containing protein 1 n=1 Tax=Hylaeus anthracinus TaxID=313031 RepID=UPI0023B8B7AD|nr:DDRGK domain-containing protein 1 [Hylaeus anthracinus]